MYKWNCSLKCFLEYSFKIGTMLNIQLCISLFFVMEQSQYMQHNLYLKVSVSSVVQDEGPHEQTLHFKEQF